MIEATPLSLKSQKKGPGIRRMITICKEVIPGRIYAAPPTKLRIKGVILRERIGSTEGPKNNQL